MLQCKTKWKKKKLENLSEMQKGKLTAQGLFCNENWIKLLNTETLFSKIETYADTKNAVISTDKDVLILCDGERSGLVAKGQHGVVGSTFAKLSIDNSEIDSNYLYHFMNNKFTWIQNRRTGTGVPHIPKDLSHILEIEYPKDITEQKKFADILSTCDEVIEKSEETIEKYKQIKAGMMQDLFTRGLNENGKLRPTYSQSPDLYKYSEELDRYIPKEWDVKTFCELYVIPSKNGLTKPSRVRGEGYKMINMGELFANKKIGNIPMELVPLSEIEKRNFEINMYDLLFARQSLVAEGAGKCSIVTNVGSYTTFESHIIRIRLDNTLYHPMYYLYLFDSNLSPTKKLIQVGAQAGIRGSELAMVYVTCPKYNEQDKIKKCLEEIDNKIDIEYKLFQKYKQIKQGLMKRLLTPPADAEIVEE